MGQGHRWKAANSLKFRKSFTVWKSEFDHLLLFYSSKSLHMLNTIIKIVKLSLKWYLTCYDYISYGGTVLWKMGWSRLKSWQVARVSAEQLRTNAKRHTIAHVLDRFFMTTGVILELFNNIFIYSSLLSGILITNRVWF